MYFMYYLTRLTYTIDDVCGQFEVTQLVKAEDKSKAKSAVEAEALKKLKQHNILEIRVHDTIIAD
jgi:hypothetical protein